MLQFTQIIEDVELQVNLFPNCFLYVKKKALMLLPWRLEKAI